MIFFFLGRIHKSLALKDTAFKGFGEVWGFQRVVAYYGMGIKG